MVLKKTSSGFRNAAQNLRQEKKPQDSRNSKNDRKGKNRHNQQRRRTVIAVLEVEVATNITHINSR